MDAGPPSVPFPSTIKSSQKARRTSGGYKALTEESLSSRFAKWTKKVSGSLQSCGIDQPLSPLRERPMPEKPPRAKMVKHHHHDDHDHHTLGTATTATISYSTDQGDVSVASEVGMEVVMSSSGGAASTDLLFAAPSGGEPAYETHTFPAGKHSFTVDKRYEMIRTIGSGAYGVVISAKDTKTKNNVAIKMVPKAFQDEIDAKRILREIKLLRHFRHDNIVKIVDMMPPNVERPQDYNDVYIVADLMETDLHRIIYSKQKLSMDHVQYFIYQVLRGLKYIHSCKVLHRDLKPSNLLVNANCDLKICDFGLARGLGTHDRGEPLTEYVVTRWYRAPEIMLACHEYSYGVDVWSVGCILAELIQRKPFVPGDDYIHQLTLITEKLGKLPDSELDFVTSEKAKRFMRKLPNKAPTHLSLQFPGAPMDALDVMRKMLEIHPGHRISVSGALQHPFFASLHNPDDEPVSSRTFDYSFENERLHRLRLQELIWQECGAFRPSCLPVPRG